MGIEEIPWLAGASRRKRWLVGVSGGMDSMALLSLLADGRFRDLVVCHLDHGLRGAGSAADARFVRREGEALGFPVELGKVRVRDLMAESGDSLETAARNARHVFFSECAVKHRCRRVLLAHHAEDQVETILWNLLRGSYGLRGMEVCSVMLVGRRSLEIHRPLLGVRRADLRAWYEGRGGGWREDPSNAVSDVVRNRLRNEVLPGLADLAKRDVVPGILRAARADAEGREVMAWAVEKAGVLDPQGRLHIGVLRALPSALQRVVVADFLKRGGVAELSGDLLNRCVALLDGVGGSVVNLPGGGFFRRRSARLFLDGG